MEQQHDEKINKQSVAYLKKRVDFLAAASGRRFRAECMTVQGFIRKSDGLGLQVGLTVTKRVGNAVERNRIKRRLRVALEQSTQAFFDRDVNIVVIARRSILCLPFEALKDILKTAFSIVVQDKQSRNQKSHCSKNLVHKSSSNDNSCK